MTCSRLAPRLATAGGLALSLVCDAAPAHTGHGTSSFFSGFVHPWLGWDHLLAMLAVGLWAVQMGRRWLVLVLPLAFAAAFTLALQLAAFVSSLPAVEPAVLGTLLVLGCLLMGRVRPGGALAVVLTGLLGLVHGYAHGIEWSAQTGLTAFASGLVLATLALHGLGLLAAAAMIWLRLEGLLRLVGGGVAVSGLAGLLALAS